MMRGRTVAVSSVCQEGRARSRQSDQQERRRGGTLSMVSIELMTGMQERSGLAVEEAAEHRGQLLLHGAGQCRTLMSGTNI